MIATMARWAAFTLAMALAGSSAALAPPLPAKVAGSQCRPGETVFYSCKFGARVGSVCAGAHQVHYRFGPAGHPAVDVGTNAGWSNLHSGGAYGGMAVEKTLRFTSGRFDYVVFMGTPGQYADRGTKPWSGIYVARDGAELSTLNCPQRVSERDWDTILEKQLPEGVSVLPETDSRFDVIY